MNPYALLSGNWGWADTDDCAATPKQIRFSEDRQKMFLSLVPRREDGTREPRREATYQVLGELPDGLRMSMDGEQRLDAAGKPIDWDLMVIEPDQICWHRSDWPAGGCTKSIHRCKA
ncbi:hypothetical protein PY254_14595 [Rhodanobacter sp. AS-Z3]|uniref:hypothetical protein n=1 Tax=Rhodanobacter sp. AS-Z3 TaxID=3031330 RepID=UPI00247988B3|nr:hypothetical protein [Rhodanobacter sp. AS-Z3]WEN14449.1 hypothetical protein PY254_14595 [Rhodanobacter sp. AS-Z3]